VHTISVDFPQSLKGDNMDLSIKRLTTGNGEPPPKKPLRQPAPVEQTEPVEPVNPADTTQPAQ
jgi:hypothetical protein